MISHDPANAEGYLSTSIRGVQPNPFGLARGPLYAYKIGRTAGERFLVRMRDWRYPAREICGSLVCFGACALNPPLIRCQVPFKAVFEPNRNIPLVGREGASAVEPPNASGRESRKIRLRPTVFDHLASA